MKRSPIPPHQITIGTRVAFSREFLRNTGQFTGWAPFARGVVHSLLPLSDDRFVATVSWDDGSASGVLNVNLVREDRLHLEPV
ncbi:hypothetical protein [Bradyrhizobium sp. SZCCHNRI2049]|uniref:hypothetical protein n=1 Tax=Bradyrhizobium sp. SZCCHNRI2049 TaxID=3057287 RepID=UPI0029165D74|nr:hypothetical protein [Bradyrhizobium sp. SZCCHNRI2049]